MRLCHGRISGLVPCTAWRAFNQFVGRQLYDSRWPRAGGCVGADEAGRQKMTRRLVAMAVIASVPPRAAIPQSAVR